MRVGRGFGVLFPALGAGGRWFKSNRPDQSSKYQSKSCSQNAGPLCSCFRNGEFFASHRKHATAI